MAQHELSQDYEECDVVEDFPKYGCYAHFVLQLLEHVEVYLEVFLAYYCLNQRSKYLIFKDFTYINSKESK